MSAEYEVRPIPLYTEQDTWARVLSDGTVKVGITDFAQKMLKEIVFVELPDVGSTVTQRQSFGSVESIKTVSEIICPISGTVTQINNDVMNDPTIMNRDPYDSGWLIYVRPSKLDEESKILLSSDAYKTLLQAR